MLRVERNYTKLYQWNNAGLRSTHWPVYANVLLDSVVNVRRRTAIFTYRQLLYNVKANRHHFLKNITVYCFSLSLCCTSAFTFHPSVLFIHIHFIVPLQPTLSLTWIVVGSRRRLIHSSLFPFSLSAVFFCSPREKEDESTGAEGASKEGEKQSDKEWRTGEDHCTDSNGSDVSDESVSLVTAWASFVKPCAGWY